MTHLNHVSDVGGAVGRKEKIYGETWNDKKYYKKMFKHISLILLMLLFSCQTENKKMTPKQKKIVEPPQIVSGEYKSIGQNLYKDSKGNIYFRTLDDSWCNDSLVVARYTDYLYFDTLINRQQLCETKKLNLVINTATFKFVSDSGRYMYYEDNNNNYFLRKMAEGGVLHICNETNPKKQK